MYPIINVFGKEVGTYALCTIIGLLVAGFVAVKIGKKRDFTLEDIIFVILSIVAGILIGGHLLYGITNYKSIGVLLHNISGMSFKQILGALSLIFGGSVFYGGFLGAIVTLSIYSVRFGKEKRKSVFDIYAVCVPLFHCFGRIGCFLGGCCYGIESKFGFTITDNALVPSINGVSRIPVSLIEASLNLLLFFCLLKLFKKEKFYGRMIYVYMLFYSVIRFNTEFLRGDDIRGIWGGLSTSQWISIVLFVVSIFYFFTYYKFAVKNKEDSNFV